MTHWDRLVAIYHNVFNIKFAIISAILNGSIVVYWNWKYGWNESVPAGLWQGALSFFSTGVTARVIQHFSPIADPIRSYFWGTAAAGSLTFIGSFVVHWINDTPALWHSCLTPTVISYTTAYATNWMTRRGHMLPGNYPT